jgi:hypothetical protein
VPEFITRAGETTGNTTQAQSQPGYTGGNHWEVLMFAATAPGTGEFVLEQRRPWEANEPPNKRFPRDDHARTEGADVAACIQLLVYLLALAGIVLGALGHDLFRGRGA